jgi:hypothetical protein
VANTYADFQAKTRSSKILLCHIEPKQRLSVFTLESGSIYKKSVNYVVVNIKENGTSLTEASSSSLSSGEWYYDNISGDLYVNTSEDSNPSSKTIIATYRLFFSNRPIDLPYDLNSGFDVHYEGRISSTSPIKKQLDYEQIGVVLESSTNVKLENTDGYFDEFYDVLIFENSKIELYSFSEILPLSEKKKLFSGIVQDKNFSESSVTFQCKDDLYKLRELVQLENFTSSDGNVPERFLNKPKRRVYGRHDQLQCVPIDSILDGFELTGTVSGTSGSATLTGTGTAFLDECSPEDDLFFDDGSQVFRFGIKTVDSDTQITLNENLDINVSGSLTINPKIPWRKKNRNWHIAGHKLRSPSTTVRIATSSRRFNLDDPSDFLDGDLINLNGTNVFISTIVGDFVTLTAAFPSGIVPLNAPVTKNPLTRVFLDGREVFIDRDWSVTNGSTDAILNLDPLSEFNIAQAVDINLTIDFTNASRTITINGADFTSQLQTRDWIRSDDINHTTWYEVLDVQYDEVANDTTVTIRTAYAGSTTSTNGQKKNVQIVDDRSIITVNCIGKEDSNGKWIRTASDAVEDLLTGDAQLTNINTSSFTESKEDAFYTLSYKIPEQIGGSSRVIREVINEINRSVIGSLVIDDDQNFKHEVLSPKKPADTQTLTDSDILRISSISSKNEIIRKVIASYRFFADKFTGDRSRLLYEFTNQFVDDLVGSNRELELDLFLYELEDATVIAQRYAFFNSLSQSIITLKGKLNLGQFTINDKVILSLDRLYKRLGAKDRRKIGIVNAITTGGSDVSLTLSDLGNIFSRVGSISPDDAQVFSSAPDSEKIVSNYVVDNSTETPDTSSDAELYNNLIG